MSGGHFDYADLTLSSEIFGCDVDTNYNLGCSENEESRKIVRKKNVFEDLQISELIYDVFCLIHSFDWYKCSDIDEKQYLDDIKYFKDKWLISTDSERLRLQIECRLQEFKEELYKAFLIERGNE